MENGYKEIEGLLPGYLSGDLPDKDRVIIDSWRKESPENFGTIILPNNGLRLFRLETVAWAP